MPYLRFSPPASPIPCGRGESVLEVLVRAGYKMKAPCGGRGVCNRCSIDVLRDDRWETVNACKTVVSQDITIRLPAGSVEEEIKGLGEVKGLGRPADIISDDEITRFFPAKRKAPIGLAIDLGTTTIALAAIDLLEGSLIDRALVLNPQISHGDDVISRIMAAKRLGLDPLRGPLLALLAETTDKMLQANRIDPDRLVTAALAGNPTMIHIFLGLDPDPIRRESFDPAAYHRPSAPLRDTGIPSNPEAEIFILPAVAGWVGGDIVAGLLASGLHRDQEVGCFIDLGTNGEIVIGNNQWLMAAACSAGPAFEGGGLRDGIRAIPGAVEEVLVHPDGSTTWATIGRRPPIGICGSGLVDLVTGLRLAGLIDGRGRFDPRRATKTTVSDSGERVLAVVPKQPGGIDRPLTISESEIDNILRAKAAIYAGVAHLAAQAGMGPNDIYHYYVAGGMGSYLNIPRAQILGLLPEVPEENIRYLGNASLAGSLQALAFQEARREAEELSRSITYVDLASGGGFHDQFLKSLFIPHTEPTAFPQSWKMIETALASL